MSAGGYLYSPFALIAAAGNIQPQLNQAYTQDDFFKFYPQFNGNISGEILDQFIAMASATVQVWRWGDTMWPYGMALFVAHFATLYLQTLGTNCSPTASSVISAAQTRGLQTSKSVGDVSVSYDFGMIADDLDGWAMWKTTQYGMQFATLAQPMGKAGIWVH